MEPSDQQRILDFLADANGDPASLALSVVNLTFADHTTEEVGRMRTALIAAAIPHWFDTAYLATLLVTSQSEAAALMSKLRMLPNVESFHARGKDACNVHEASRISLREHLRTCDFDLWCAYAKRAYLHTEAGDQAFEQVEALYHFFATDAVDSAEKCASLQRSFRGNLDSTSILSHVLSELTAEGWIQGAALVEAVRTILWYEWSKGNVSTLGTRPQELLDMARANSHPSRIVDSLQLVSEVEVSHGNREAAQRILSEALELCRELVVADPENCERLRELSVTLEMLGDIAMARGELTRAESYFAESMSIRERLASLDPNSSDWHFLVGLSNERLGDVAVKQGFHDRALNFYRHRRDIISHLLETAPECSAWLRDLSVAYEKLGDVARAQKDYLEARDFFDKSRCLSEQLVQRDPSNLIWQRDLSVAINKLGLVAKDLAESSLALRCFREALAIRERLAESDKSNKDWQRDLSYNLTLVAEVLMVQEDWGKALLLMERSREIDEMLVRSDSTQITWQDDLKCSQQMVNQLREKINKLLQQKPT